MKITSNITMLNSRLMLFMRAYKVEFEIGKDFEMLPDRGSIFYFLKKRGFSFDKNTFDNQGNFKGDNYGNFKLEKIELEDFKNSGSNDIVSVMNDRILIYLNQNENVQQHKNSFLKSANSFSQALDFMIENIGLINEFRIDENEIEQKKHPHYSLWDYFISFIVYGADRKEIVYIELGYD